MRAEKKFGEAEDRVEARHVAPDRQVIADVRWMRLSDLPERDRVYLWAAGLLGVGDFLREAESWGDAVSHAGTES